MCRLINNYIFNLNFCTFLGHIYPLILGCYTKKLSGTSRLARSSHSVPCDVHGLALAIIYCLAPLIAFAFTWRCSRPGPQLSLLPI